jgi:hypothetical protein
LTLLNFLTQFVGLHSLHARAAIYFHKVYVLTHWNAEPMIVNDPDYIITTEYGGTTVFYDGIAYRYTE